MPIFVEHRSRFTRSISHRELGTGFRAIDPNGHRDSAHSSSSSRLMAIITGLPLLSIFKRDDYRALATCHASRASNKIESIITILLGDVITRVSSCQSPAKLLFSSRVQRVCSSLRRCLTVISDYVLDYAEDRSLARQDSRSILRRTARLPPLRYSHRG